MANKIEGNKSYASVSQKVNASEAAIWKKAAEAAGDMTFQVGIVNGDIRAKVSTTAQPTNAKFAEFWRNVRPIQTNRINGTK